MDRRARPAEWMADLDERYRRASGLEHRRWYSIFYSQIKPSNVMVLGLNPGGDPATWTAEKGLASSGWYEDGQHEYVDMDYPIAAAMRPFLVEVLGLDSPEELRSVPKANIAFRRSSSSDELSIPIRQAVREASPFVRELIGAVTPSVIIIEGTQTARLFFEEHTSVQSSLPDLPTVETPNGRHRARIFEASNAVLWDGSNVAVAAIGHPSRYASRREWPRVAALTREVVAAYG